jgi:hypothetical protein
MRYSLAFAQLTYLLKTKHTNEMTTSMKTKSTSQSAYFNPRILIGFALCSVGLLLALAGLSKSVLGMIGTPAAANPVPLINQPLAPDAVAPGGAEFTLTVNGTGFVSGSVVNWDGSARATTFVNSSQLTATILASDIATASTASVTVANPSPGGGASNVVFFAVTLPASSISLNRTDYATGADPSTAATGDFNADGKVDLAVVDSGPPVNVSILLGNGDGTFQPHVDYPISGAGGITTGDFNGDGRIDLAIANFLGNAVSVLIGNGDGTFQEAASYATGSGPEAVIAGDFNGDGRLDLALTVLFNQAVSILLGNGDGTFRPHKNYSTAGNSIRMTTGDFNGDGRLDLAVADFDSDKVSILLGNGDGTFQAHADYVIPNPASSVLAADFNEDGKLDLAVSTSSDVTSILLGNGDGTFQTHVDYAGGCESPPGGCEPTTADLNGDGKLDLAIPNLTNPTVSVLFGNGDATFQTPTNFAVASPNNFVVTGDFNEDGRLDLVVEDSAGADDTVSVLLQGTTVNQNCLQPPPGLVSWWSGDRTAEDVQGTNNGTLVNGASFAKGMVGPGFFFDGIDDYISVPNNASLNPGTGDFTFEFWISTTNSGVREAVLEKRPNCGCANLYSIKVNADGTIVSETLQDVNCTNFVTVTSTFPINDGVFHHIALTRQGVNVTLFIDGVQNATGSSPTTCDLSNTAPFVVGLTVCTFDRTFSGKIDELTYYASALSPSAVQAIYTAGAAGKCKPEIFVSSITPSYTVSGSRYLVSTSVVIQDTNGIGTSGATANVKTVFPNGSSLVFPAPTDDSGNASFSFYTSETGLYKFKVTRVTHPTRTYDASLNIETTDTLVIP